jgi:hypothetical protein
MGIIRRGAGRHFRPNRLPSYIRDPWFPATFSSYTFVLFSNRRSRLGRSLFNSDKVILLVDSLYAEAIKAVNARATLSASNPELISILDDIKFEARL